MATSHRRLDTERWQAVLPHLDRALEMTDAERVPWLASLHLESPGVAEDVESLLEQRETLNRKGFLEQTAASWTALPSLAGQVIGAYTLRSLVGEGGMGSVWLAERSDGRFEGQAAVKLLNMGLLSPVGRERFRREGSAVARLAHPGIARLLDAGVSTGGQPYLVLEFIPGRRIDAFADESRLGVEERIGLVQQVLSAVGHAHANLIVHRDLKPSNILVTADGTAKLLDFGIAKLLATEPGEAPPALTREDRLLTPEYAAPEQVRGGSITTATDTYAVGLLLYLLLSGRRAHDVGGRTPTEIERIVCEAPPPPLRASRVPADLEAIVMKALRKEPERRYASAAAMEDDLRRFLEGRPVLARPESALYRLRKFVGRHRAGVVIGLALLFLLAAGVLRERALRARAEAEARKADAVKDYLVSVFEVSDPFGEPDPHGGDTKARTLLERGVARIDSSLGHEPVVQTELRGVLGRVYQKLGLYDSAAPLLERALREKRALHGNRSLVVAESADQLGVVMSELNQFERSEALLWEALETRRALLGNANPDTAASLDHVATMLQERNDYDRAEPLFREALGIRRQLFGSENQYVADSLNNLGVLLYLKGGYDEAESLYREAVAINTRLLGVDHPTTTITVHNLAQDQLARGEIEEAVALLRSSLASKRRILGNAHPNVTVHLNNLGITLAQEKGELVEAEALILEALAGDRQTFGERHSFVAESLDNLGTVLRLKGDFDEAERTYRQALEMNRGLFDANHARIGKNLNNLGLSLHWRGDVEGAIALFRQALEVLSRAVGEKHLRYIGATVNLGKALLEQGKAAEAEALFRKALAALDPRNRGHRAHMSRALVGLGQALLDQGRPAEAQPLLERALELSRQRFGESDWRTGEAELVLGSCLSAGREYARAEPLLREAEAALATQRRAQPRLVESARLALAGIPRR